MTDDTTTTGDLGRATAVLRGGAAGAVDRVRLDYEGRFLRRRRLTTEAGATLVVDLPETVSLEDGDGLALERGGHVAVSAAPEPLIAVRGPSLARLAWHIGNRHTPCRIEEGRLLIRADPVLEAMLVRLGAETEAVTGPFSPEGGAYGHGRTLGHSHGEAEGGAYRHDHGHAHDHGHGHHHHDHGHGHHGHGHGHHDHGSGAHTHEHSDDPSHRHG